MPSLGSIYVIAFDSGNIKVGAGADGVRRLREHRANAAGYGVKAIAEWASPPHPGFEANEQLLIRICTALADQRIGREYFTGLDFDFVQRTARWMSDKSANRSL
jgi:hypothetical protein